MSHTVHNVRKKKVALLDVFIFSHIFVLDEEELFFTQHKLSY